MKTNYATYTFKQSLNKLLAMAGKYSIKTTTFLFLVFTKDYSSMGQFYSWKHKHNIRRAELVMDPEYLIRRYFLHNNRL